MKSTQTIEIPTKRISYLDFKSEEFHTKKQEEALAKLNEEEFRAFVQSSFAGEVPCFFSYEQLFCRIFIVKEGQDRAITSLQEFTRHDIARYFLSMNQNYASNPLTFIFYILDKFPFVLRHECFIQPLCATINTKEKLIEISKRKYPKFNDKYAVKCFLEDYPIPELDGLAYSLETCKELDEALPMLSLDIVSLVGKYAFGYNPTIDGRRTIPSSLSCTFFTDRWLFSPLSEEKVKEAIEVFYQEESFADGIVLEGAPAALLFVININSPHYNTYSTRLSQLINENQVWYQSDKANEKEFFTVCQARESLDSNADIQAIYTQSKARFYCQTAKGMKLAALLAINLGLMSPKSIQLCVETVLNYETEPTLSKKDVKGKCKPLKNFVGTELTTRFKTSAQITGLQLLERLRATHFTQKRWAEVTKTLDDHCTEQDPKYRSAIKALGIS